MKNKLNKFLVVMCILTMAFGLTACGKEVKNIEYDELQLGPALETFVLASLPTLSVEDVEANELQMDDETYVVYHKAAESWDKAKVELGGIQEILGTSLSSDEEKITAIVKVAGTTGRTAEVEILLDKRMAPQSITVNIDRSFGENMTNAGLNTLLGMGTVFVVLILIAIIIYLLKYISVIEDMFKKKKEPKESAAAAAADKAVAQIIETEELSDDLELVAVISAAIAAYEEAAGGSGDGYVVRSIKRRY